MSDTIKSIYGKQYDYTGLANIPDIVEIDDTLSIEGKAADAKAVGDAISGLSGGTFSGNATDVTYDNANSGMEATNIQEAIDELKASQGSGGNVDLTGYATEQFVRDGYQPKGDYLASTGLTSAINSALAQAKARGEFDGKDGKTPVKGVDYFTEADNAEMVSAVIAALPVYNGEVV